MGVEDRPLDRRVDELIEEWDRIRDEEGPAAGQALLDALPSDIRAQVEPVAMRLLAVERVLSTELGERSTVHGEGSVPIGVLGRYEILEKHAEGGMGLVYRARDVELGRVVAYKVLQPKYENNPEARERFQREAESTSRLEHPGIPPIYGSVLDGSGLPAYAMEFFEGNTLDDAIRQHHNATATEPDLEPRPTRNELLRHFITSCHVVAFAHARNYVHGDLKPQNILIDHDGVRVVDWGISRFVGHQGDAISLRIVSRGFHGPTALKDGSPATFASDIWALGATLHTLLTGTPPATDARQGGIAGTNVPPALTAVCRKAMAAEPENRYATASAIAEDVRRFIDDEPVSVYRDGLPTRFRRWGRRHSGIAAGSAVAGLLIVAVTILFIGYVMLRRSRTDATGREILIQAERRADDAKATFDLAKWADALSEVRRAESLLASGGGSLKLTALAQRRLKEYGDALEGEQRNRRMVDDLREARLEGAAVTTRQIGEFDRDAKIAAYRRAFRQFQIDIDSLPISEAARLIKSSRIRDDLVFAVDDYRSDSHNDDVKKRLLSIARQADSDAERCAIRDAIDRGDSASVRRVAERIDMSKAPTPHLILLGEYFLQAGEQDVARRLLQDAQRHHPDDFWINLDLAKSSFFSKPRRIDDAVRFFTAALALRPLSPGAHMNLGNALMERHELKAAIAEFRRAITLKPDFPMAHYNLGNALDDDGKTSEAISEYRLAIKQATEFKLGFPQAHYNLGAALLRERQLDRAITEFRRALKQDAGHARAHNNLGIAYMQKGELDRAADEFRRAIQANMPGFADPHFNLGVYLSGNGDLDGASEEYRKAIAIKPDFAEPHVFLGETLSNQGHFEEALTELRLAAELASRREGLRQLTNKLIKDCEKLIELRSRLPGIIFGTTKPADVDELIGFAQVCQFTRQYDAASVLFERLFEMNAKQPVNLEVGHYFLAACAAAQASTGNGKDDPPLGQAARERWRKKSLEWLKAGLHILEAQVAGAANDQQIMATTTLKQWKANPALDGLRGEAPEYREFWKHVDELLKSIERMPQ